MKTWHDLDLTMRALLGAQGGERVIAVRPSLVVACKGNGNSAILLSQFLYWSARTTDAAGWFYDTQVELQIQTGLGETAQLTARQLLKKLGFIEDQRRGNPARLFYRVDLERVAAAILDANTYLESVLGPKQDSAHAPPLESAQAPKQDSAHAPTLSTIDSPKIPTYSARGRASRSSIKGKTKAPASCPRCHGQGWYVDPQRDWEGQRPCLH